MILEGSGNLHITISDHGIGFDLTKANSNGHYGLSNMEKRAIEIDGTLAIVTSPGQGTTIELDFPIYEDGKGVRAHTEMASY